LDKEIGPINLRQRGDGEELELSVGNRGRERDGRRYSTVKAREIDYMRYTSRARGKSVKGVEERDAKETERGSKVSSSSGSRADSRVRTDNRESEAGREIVRERPAVSQSRRSSRVRYTVREIDELRERDRGRTIVSASQSRRSSRSGYSGRGLVE